MSLTKNGFRLQFTSPVPDSATELSNYSMKRYRYEDGPNYGGDKLDETPLTVTKVAKVDPKTIELEIADLKDGGHVHELTVGLKELRSQVHCYTVNRFREE